MGAQSSVRRRPDLSGMQPVVVARRSQAWRPFLPCAVIGGPFFLVLVVGLVASTPCVAALTSLRWLLLPGLNVIAADAEGLGVRKFLVRSFVPWSVIEQVRTHESGPRPEWSRGPALYTVELVRSDRHLHTYVEVLAIGAANADNRHRLREQCEAHGIPFQGS